MNFKAFLETLRARDSGVFGTSISQGQADGCAALLDAMDGYPIDHAAHVLSEVYHETGRGMLPVKETVYPSSKNKNPSDATVIARLDRAFTKGQIKRIYWRNGFFGRGQIQLTHEANYEKGRALTGVDILNRPDLALQLDVSSTIAAEGCRVGMFTSKKLSDFDGPNYDHYNARAIVNGDKRKNGKAIAGYAAAFTKALAAAGWGAQITPQPTDHVPVYPTKTLATGPKPRFTGKSTAAGAAVAVGAALWGAFRYYFGG